MELRLISKKNHEDRKIVTIKNIAIGDGSLVVIAGPCSVESRDQIFKTAEFVKSQGANILRGGAYKPRTSPYSFQGLGEDGLRLLREAGDSFQLPVISEVMDTREVEMISSYVDILQIGSRNMQNYSLLKEVGKLNKPVLLKRGMAASLEDWLLAAEYIASEGNDNIILCERGIRTFESYTRNTLDLSVVPLVKSMSILPIIVDPSHGTGLRSLILPMSKASIAAGADGVMIEVHPIPEKALSDGFQSLDFDEFTDLMGKIKPIHQCINE